MSAPADTVERWRRDVPTALRPIFDDLIADDCRPRIAVAALAYADGLLAGREQTQAAVSHRYDVSIGAIAHWYQPVLEDVRDARRGPATKAALDAWTLGGETR